MKIKYYILLTILLFSLYAKSDSPLTVDNIYTDKGKLKLETNITYSNYEQNEINVAEPITVQTTTNSFINIPTSIRKSQNNADVLIGTIGFRYGLTGQTDVYGNISSLYEENRLFNGIDEYKTKNDYLSDANLGVSHSFLPEGQDYGVVGFLETSVYKKMLDKSSKFNSGIIGMTAYTVNDPIVLSLTSSYHFNNKLDTEMGKYNPSNYFVIHPSVAFAANEQISLMAGIQWINRYAEQINQQNISARNTATYAKLGLGFSVSNNTTINASTRFKISGNNNSELNFNVIHSL